MSPDTISHQLSLSLRFIDHFSGEVVADELPVRLAADSNGP